MKLTFKRPKPTQKNIVLIVSLFLALAYLIVVAGTLIISAYLGDIFESLLPIGTVSFPIIVVLVTANLTVNRESNKSQENKQAFYQNACQNGESNV